MKRIITLLLTGFLLMSGSVPATAQKPVTAGPDGWIRQNDLNTPPDKITASPKLPPGFKGTWLNPNAKGNDPNKIYIEVNGSTLYPDVDPYLDKNDRTMVPVRFVAEALNSKVTWDAQDNRGRIEVTRKGKTILLWIDQSVANVDGQALQMDTTAVLKNNRTFVPVRFVAEAFGAEVLWSDGDKKVFITLTK